jgi:hypothetical protein
MLTAGRWSSILTAFSSSLVATACAVDGWPGAGDDDDSADEQGEVDGGLADDLVVLIQVCRTGGADHTSIRAAIAAAPRGALITVCPGTYRERLSIIEKPLTIRGTGGAAETILDAEGGGPAVVVQNTSNAGLQLEGLTIRGGDNGAAGGGVRCLESRLRLANSVVRDNRGQGGGGGLYSFRCTLEAVDSTFVANTGGERGGGAYLVETSGEVSGSLFQGNQATNGAALHVREGSVVVRGNDMRSNIASLRGGALYHNSDALVEDNEMVANRAGWTGGGVHIVGHDPVLRRNLIRNNRSVNDGGGIYVHQGTATIIDCQVIGNVSEDDGGGIRLFESRARIEGNRVIGNVSADGGGGMRASHEPSLILDNVFRDNEATFGGGIDMDNDSSVVRGGVIEGNRAWRGGGISGSLFPWLGATIDGVRIAGNTAGYGGGIYLEDNFQRVALRDLELIGNQADRGGGLFVRSTNLTVRNSVLARNQADEGGGLYVGAPGPWTDPCPCPPASPSFDVDFVVLHGNRAPSGAQVWIDTGGLSIGNSILSGHTGTAVVASGPDPDWRYTDTVPAIFSGMTNPTGASGNISADPGFVDLVSYALRAGSPCRNGGDPALQDPDGTRADMGRHGGPEAP